MYNMAAIYISFWYWGHLFRQKAIRYVVKCFVGLEHFRVRGLVRDAACVCLAPCACELISCLRRTILRSRAVVCALVMLPCGSNCFKSASTWIGDILGMKLAKI